MFYNAALMEKINKKQRDAMIPKGQEVPVSKIALLAYAHAHAGVADLMLASMAVRKAKASAQIRAGTFESEWGRTNVEYNTPVEEEVQEDEVTGGSAGEQEEDAVQGGEIQLKFEDIFRETER